MTKNETVLSTSELWAKLFKSPSVNDYFSEASESGELPTFSSYITELAASRGEKTVKILERGQLESSMGYHLFRGTRNPSRDTVIQLAFGFEMTPDAAQELLKIARMSPLHPKVKRDAMISYCLYHKTNIMELNIYLHENGLPLLGGF